MDLLPGLMLERCISLLIGLLEPFKLIECGIRVGNPELGDDALGPKVCMCQMIFWGPIVNRSSLIAPVVIHHAPDPGLFILQTLQEPHQQDFSIFHSPPPACTFQGGARFTCIEDLPPTHRSEYEAVAAASHHAQSA